jgi:hypothetical protein
VKALRRLVLRDHRCWGLGSREHACLQRLVCGLLGVCVLACNVGSAVGGGCVKRLTECGGDCVNVGSDPENCGTCGHQCGGGSECKAGVCMASQSSSPLRPDEGDAEALLPADEVRREATPTDAGKSSQHRACSLVSDSGAERQRTLDADAQTHGTADCSPDAMLSVEAP